MGPVNLLSYLWNFAIPTSDHNANWLLFDDREHPCTSLVHSVSRFLSFTFTRFLSFHQSATPNRAGICQQIMKGTIHGPQFILWPHQINSPQRISSVSEDDFCVYWAGRDLVVQNARISQTNIVPTHCTHTTLVYGIYIFTYMVCILYNIQYVHYITYFFVY